MDEFKFDNVSASIGISHALKNSVRSLVVLIEQWSRYLTSAEEEGQLTEELAKEAHNSVEAFGEALAVVHQIVGGLHDQIVSAFPSACPANRTEPDFGTEPEDDPICQEVPEANDDE